MWQDMCHLESVKSFPCKRDSIVVPSLITISAHAFKCLVLVKPARYDATMAIADQTGTAEG
jgi:hypothetical protein